MGHVRIGGSLPRPPSDLIGMPSWPARKQTRRYNGRKARRLPPLHRNATADRRRRDRQRPTGKRSLLGLSCSNQRPSTPAVLAAPQRTPPTAVTKPCAKSQLKSAACSAEAASIDPKQIATAATGATCRARNACSTFDGVSARQTWPPGGQCCYRCDKNAGGRDWLPQNRGRIIITRIDELLRKPARAGTTVPRARKLPNEN